jgi:hypothetical protein
MSTATTLLTDGEAATLLRMLPTRLAKLARAGGVPHVLLPDGELRFDRADLERWIADHKRAAQGAAP